MAKKTGPSSSEAEARAASEAEQKKRAWIQNVAGLGASPELIAELLVPPMDVDQLKANYARELVAGPASTDLRVLVQLRAQIDKGNMSAIKLWLEERMGWMQNPGKPNGETPPASLTAPPTTMPTAQSLSAKILSFHRK